MEPTSTLRVKAHDLVSQQITPLIQLSPPALEQLNTTAHKASQRPGFRYPLRI